MRFSLAEQRGHEEVGGELDDDELRRLSDALDEGEAQYQRGEYVDAEVVLRELGAGVQSAR